MMEEDEIIAALGPWRERVLRPAWKPVVAPGDGPPTASKYCGTPWTGADQPWPACASCHAPMALVLQLDLDELPGVGGRFGSGLLQFFFCSQAGSGCFADDAYLPFSDKATRVRVIRPTPQGEARPVPPDYNPTPAPARRIVGWDPIGDDRPSFYEYGEHGLVADYDLTRGMMRIRCPELDLDLTGHDGMIDAITAADPNDKLGGWPRWAQGLEYPSCPRCGQRMGLVMQVTSYDHLQDAFGDFGIGHITQCPDHKDVVAFGSAR